MHTHTHMHTHTYRGKSYVNESAREEDINDSFVNLKAPRTVIGAHGNGSLFLIQVYTN